MQKKGKFVFSLLSVAAVAGGAYYFVKNILNKNSEDDFEDFEDDFEDFDLDDEQPEVSSEGREYVTINLTETSAPAEDAVVAEEAKVEEVSEAVATEADSEKVTTDNAKVTTEE